MVRKEKLVWLKFKKEDVEAVVLKLARQGISQEGIPPLLFDRFQAGEVRLRLRRGQVLGRGPCRRVRAQGLYESSGMLRRR